VLRNGECTDGLPGRGTLRARNREKAGKGAKKFATVEVTLASTRRARADLEVSSPRSSLRSPYASCDRPPRAWLGETSRGGGIGFCSPSACQMPGDGLKTATGFKETRMGRCRRCLPVRGSVHQLRLDPLPGPEIAPAAPARRWRRNLHAPDASIRVGERAAVWPAGPTVDEKCQDCGRGELRSRMGMRFLDWLRQITRGGIATKPARFPTRDWWLRALSGGLHPDAYLREANLSGLRSSACRFQRAGSLIRSGTGR
jgi:hypothetical protein